MKRDRWIALVAALLVTGAALAGAEGEKPGHSYVGAGKCKRCHSSAKKGAQYKVWADSKHAHAFEVLATPKAIEIAKAKGIQEPQKAAECLQCHVTGHGQPAERLAASYSDSAGVGCESCHGPGGDYWTKEVMLEIRQGKSDGAKYGMQRVTKETCAKCHNEKGTSGKFVDWPADSAKIAHPIPPGSETGE